MILLKIFAYKFWRAENKVPPLKVKFKKSLLSFKEITSTRQHAVVLRQIESLMKAQKDTEEGHQLDQLVRLVQDFEGQQLSTCFPTSLNIRAK